jgi:hypothetical protein
MLFKKSSFRSLLGDVSAVLPAWLIGLLIDPLTATLSFLFFGTILIVLRRRLWADSPNRGRIACGILSIVVSSITTITLAFGMTGPLLGLIVAAGMVAAAEVLTRRRGASLLLGFPVTSVLVLVVTGALLSVLFMENMIARWPTEEFIKPLSSASDAPNWDATLKKNAVAVVRKAISRDAKDMAAVDKLNIELTTEYGGLRGLLNPGGVYVTLYEKSGFQARGHGTGGSDVLENLLRAAQSAIAKQPRKPRSNKRRPRMWNDSLIGTHIQIDVPGPARPVWTRPVFSLIGGPLRAAHQSLKKLKAPALSFNLAYEVEAGVDGLIIRKGDDGQEAVMLPGDVVTRGWATPRVRSAPRKIEGMLYRTWRNETGGELDLSANDFELLKFRTLCFGEPTDGAKIVDWYRGNVLLDKSPDRESLIQRTVLAADWLARQVQQPPTLRKNAPLFKNKTSVGRFHYEVFPPHKGRSDDYNLPRHAGSVYGLFAFHRASLDEPRFEKAGKRALNAGLYALEYVVENLGSPDPVKSPQMLCFMDKKGNASSGSTALAAMALAGLARPGQISDDGIRDRVAVLAIEKQLRGMAMCLQEMIDPDGAVFHDYREAQTHDKVLKEPLYFPGEVMLALVRVSRRLSDESYLEAARRIGDRQSRLMPWPAKLGWPYSGDHWIIQALGELGELSSERQYAELSVLMGRGYLREQYPPQGYTYPDYRGAYRRVADLPRTTRAASRGEALGGAMYAARFLGEDPTDFEEALIEGARHLMEQQFVPENSHFVPAGMDVLGAIRMGLVDNHCRIDNNQHGLVAMLHAFEANNHRMRRR